MKSEIDMQVDDISGEFEELKFDYMHEVHYEIPEFNVVFMWPDGSWVYADDHEDGLDSWRGYDFRELKVPVWIDVDEFVEREMCRDNELYINMGIIIDEHRS